MSQTDKNRPLYMISVAADLAGLHPQTLRIYESKGLVTPQRTSGNTRMYSQADVERLELITQLTDEGINLAGVVRILDMKERMAKQEAENEELRRQLAQAKEQLHEYEVRQTITTLAKRDDGNAALAQLMGRQIPRGLM
ncbi:MAG: heat shock protein transcriptional repressor HspR [Coriobacteriales bacterium]